MKCYIIVDSEIAGFQFTVDGTTASAGTGGDAAAAGFTVSTGGSLYLVFHLLEELYLLVAEH